MITLQHKGKLAALAACCMLSLAAPAQAGFASPDRSQFGSFVEAGGRYDREIVVGAGTRWINVKAGETVRFVLPGASASFTWRFDPFGGGVADLSVLAPAGMAAPSIKVYIAEDGRYYGS